MRSVVDSRSGRGQALVEIALVLPLFLTVLLGIMVIGIGLFYQQQVTNAAREAARYAAIHSASSACPTSSWKQPSPGMLPDPSVLVGSSQTCDPASATPQWPNMQAHGRRLAGFGFDADALHFAACWSGYTDPVIEATGQPAWDRPPVRPDGADPDTEPDENDWAACTIGGIDPVTNTGDLGCPPPRTVAADDKASNLAVSSLATANQVTVYACYEWQPPAAGFLLIPETITLGATISEAMHHQR